MKFWKLSGPDSRRGIAWWDNEAIKKVREVYGESFVDMPGLRPPDVPLYVLLTSKTITDIVWAGIGTCLIQDHVLRMFQEQGFTGFDVLSVQSRMKIREKVPDPCDEQLGVRASDAAKVEIPTLWEVRILGWGGMAPPESGVHPVKTEYGDEYTNWTDPSHLIDEKQWDGSDFFMVWPFPFQILITDRVAKFIRENKLKAVKLTPVEKMTRPWHSSDTVSHRELRRWMPDPRAREIGEPLGIY